MKNIGKATIEYNEKGEAISASFQANVDFKATEDLLKQLKRIPAPSKEVVASNAALVFGAWFNATEAYLDDIEIGDRTKMSVETSIEQCESYESGVIKKCVIEYNLVSK